MAFPEALAPEPARSAVAELSRWTGWAGAVSSLALVAGLSLWVWDLATRDARAVPVVRALEGPARAAPDVPGGREAAHQGLAVNAVAAEGAAPTPADQVVLAPIPAGPAPEDTTVTPQPREVAASPVVGGNLRSAVQAALGQALGAPAPDPAVPATAASRPPGASPVDAAPQLPRPVPRPDPALATRAQPAAPALAAAAPAPARLDPATLEPGTRLVQLGAFGSAEEADRAWDGLNNRFGPYLGDKARIVEETEMGGAQIWRLRAAGFADLSEARGLCAVLLAEHADCIPVLTR